MHCNNLLRRIFREGNSRAKKAKTPMSKFAVLVDNDNEKQYYFDCSGCKMSHSVRVRGPQPRWEVSGFEEDAPTVSPSVLVTAPGLRCHSFIKNGEIQFLGDCTHGLKNKTVVLEDVG